MARTTGKFGVALGMTLLLSTACEQKPQEKTEEIYQGVAELDNRRLAFELSGRIVSIQAREGDHVAAGTLIATLDGALDAQSRAAQELQAKAAEVEARLVSKGARPEEVASQRARIRAAKAAEDLLKKKLERERGLNQRGVTPDAVVDDLEGQLARSTAEREALESSLADLQRGARPEEREVAKVKAEAARAAVKLDDLKIGRSELRAPVDCVVLDVLHEPGEIVATGAPVFTVADPGRVYAKVFVPQGKLAGIDVGDRASVNADGLGRILGGHVEHIGRTAEFTPRYLFSDRERPNLVMRVKVRIDDPGALLHAGVPVFVTIDRNTPRSVASVPTSTGSTP